MTRFEANLNGYYGPYWIKDALREIDKAERNIETGEMLIDSDGVARWASNGNCIMDDMAEIVEFTKYAAKIDREAIRAAREKEDAEFIESYRANRRKTGYSEEELFEMRAAFGAGTEIVDVLTGEKILL